MKLRYTFSFYLALCGTLTTLTGCSRAASSFAPPSVQDQIKAQLRNKGPNAFASLKKGAGGGSMAVPCQLDDVALYCMIDSGAAASQVDNHDEKIRNYVSLGSKTTEGLDGKARSANNTILIQNLQVLGMSIEKVLFAREDDLSFPQQLPNEGTDGIIGSDIFASHAMFFDFDHQEVHFDESAPSSMSRQDMTLLESHQPVMSMTFNGVAAKGIWDTGSFITLVDQTFLENNISSFTDLGDAGFNVEDGTGQSVPMKLYRADNLVIGPITFSHLIVGATSFDQFNSAISMPIQVLIGYNAISKANWYIDYPNKQWSAEMK